MLAIGRALMSQPKFLMLDEPSLGLAPLLVKTIFEKIVEINREHGLTILLVEQNANLALEISHFGYVLETGKIILQGDSASLRAKSAGEERLSRRLRHALRSDQNAVEAGGIRGIRIDDDIGIGGRIVGGEE